ncbi:MAG: porin [Verrucomicrobiota bacterium]
MASIRVQSLEVSTLLAILAASLLVEVGLPGQAFAATLPGIAALAASNIAAPAESGPELLKQRVQVTVETNTPPVAGATNGPPAKARTFRLKSSWEGWNGLHLEFTRKTLLGQWAPDVTNVERLNLEDRARELDPGKSAPVGTIVQIFHLEELRMNGKVGAKIAVDGAAYATGKEFQDFTAGAELRRARIYGKGDCLLLLPVSYQLELGYIPNQFYIEESYLAFKNIPYIGQLKFGQYQAPMGLDAIASSRDITFMEPATPIQALAPGVNAGVQMGQPIFNERATWALGLFTDGVGKDFGDASKDYGRAITRVTWLPIYQPNPEQPGSARLLHLGLSANILYSSDSTVRYQARPESHLAPHVVDTGDISARGALVIGGEAAWSNGPFSVQGEYLHSIVDQVGGNRLNFDGFYASASWFLTGESRPYDRTEGVFARVTPKRNFNPGEGGWGAWEIAGRYSFLDLNSGDIQGGRVGMFMAGVNWYLHSHVKWRFDYGIGRVSGRTPEGYLNIFETRMEVDF